MSLLDVWNGFPLILRFGLVVMLLVVVFGTGMALWRGGKSQSKAYSAEVCDRRIARLRNRLDRQIEIRSGAGLSGVLNAVTGGNTPETQRRADLETRRLERELALWTRRRALHRHYSPDQATGRRGKRNKSQPADDAPPAPHYVVFENAGLARTHPHTPIPTSPQVIDTGYDDLDNPWFVAQLIPGQTFADWQDKAARLASAWFVPAVTVEPAGTNQVKVTAMVSKF